MKIGCTSAIGPVARAAAWNTAAMITRPMPASHMRRPSRFLMSERCMALSAGTWAAALRCRTAAQALLADVSSAKMTHSRVSTVTWTGTCTWWTPRTSAAVTPPITRPR